MIDAVRRWWQGDDTMYIGTGFVERRNLQAQQPIDFPERRATLRIRAENERLARESEETLQTIRAMADALDDLGKDDGD